MFINNSGGKSVGRGLSGCRVAVDFCEIILNYISVRPVGHVWRSFISSALKYSIVLHRVRSTTTAAAAAMLDHISLCNVKDFCLWGHFWSKRKYFWLWFPATFLGSVTWPEQVWLVLGVWASGSLCLRSTLVFDHVIRLVQRSERPSKPLNSVFTFCWFCFKLVSAAPFSSDFKVFGSRLYESSWFKVLKTARQVFVFTNTN